MHAYRSARGWDWNTEAFLASWKETENFVLLLPHGEAGLFRFTAEPQALYIRDVQIYGRYQRQGAGTFAVRYVERLASERGLAKVRLRVFRENPAQRLYSRLRYVLVAEDDGGLLRFEKHVS